VKQNLKTGISSGIILLICLLFTDAVAGRASAAAGEAVLVGVSGGVEVLRGGGWEAAVLEESLEPGDRVRTGAGAGAVILYPSGTQVKIGELSSVTVLDSVPGRGGGGLDLESGRAWSRVNKLSGEKESFEIRTPVAICGARGTTFAMDVDDSGSSVLTVVEGAADFSNEFGGVVVGASRQSVAEPGKAPTPPKVVDTTHWVEWALQIRAMGNPVESPYYDLGVGRLERLHDEISGDYDDTGDPYHLLELARVLYDLGELGAAEEEFVSALDYQETLWGAMHGTAMVALARGDVAAAERGFDDLLWSIDDYIDQAGESGTAYDEVEADEYTAQAYFGLGLAAMKSGALTDAGGHFEKALDYNQELWVAQIAAAEVSIRRGEPLAAEEYLDAALETSPDSYQALMRMGLVQMALNRPGEAVNYVLEALDHAPRSSAATGALARVRFFNGEYEQARMAAEDALEIDPHNPAAREIMARIFIIEDNLRAAVREAMTSLALDDSNPFAHDDLAMVYYVYRNYSGAILHWEKAVELDPNFTAAKVNLARLYNELEETGLARKAEKLAREVIEKEGQNGGAWSELGRALELQRRYRESEEAYMRAL